MICSIAIGSAARGDVDGTSDKDAVVVGSSLDAVVREKGRLEAAGWSVTPYSLTKFEVLAGRGSLFLKHVLDEGVTLRGDQSVLNDTRKLWSARTCYLDEIEDNLNFLMLLRCVPNTQQGYLAAVDIITCSIRNILVRRLANAGEYTFSWSQIFCAGVRHQFLKADCGRALRWARRVKNMRRAGLYLPVQRGKVDEVLMLFDSILDGATLRVGQSRMEIERAALAFDQWSYGRLRGYELLAATDQGDPALVRLMGAATAPAYFLSGRMGI